MTYNHDAATTLLERGNSLNPQLTALKTRIFHEIRHLVYLKDIETTDRDTLVRYLVAKADVLNSRTLALHLTAVSQWHHYQGLTDPVRDPLVCKTMEGIRRTHGQPN